ncbi:dihydropteroate synthase [Streptomyces parvus]|uniref:Dihydropteroate synthase n=1 Tax=Streptomyces parvus TaxID=66428 RepID=A0A7K3S1P3_9ACTN|nr:dihydropteroate synthase [Streptomyces parvus]
MSAYRYRPSGLPACGRCGVMGILNVTPDSFSDGGLWLDAWERLARPVLVAASRKRFLGALPAGPVTGEPRPARARDAATGAVSALAAAQGAWAVRVHEVGATADAVRVEAALREARNARTEHGRK